MSIETIGEAATLLVTEREARCARWRGVAVELPAASRVRAALEDNTQDGVRRALRDCMRVVAASALPTSCLLAGAKVDSLTAAQATSVLLRATAEERLVAVRRALRHDVAGGISDRDATAAIYATLGSATIVEAAQLGLLYTVDTVAARGSRVAHQWDWTGFVPSARGGDVAAEVARRAIAQRRPIPSGALLRVSRHAATSRTGTAVIAQVLGVYHADGTCADDEVAS